MKKTDNKTMKNFKELLLLSNIARLTTAKINNNYVPILSKYKTFEDLVDFLKQDYGEDKIEKALEKMEKTLNELPDYVKVVTISDKEYPQKLKDMGSKAPLFFYALGDISILNKPNVAVVGTRKPSLSTQNFEYKFTKEIIEQTERVIVSGLALGCDKIAHTVATDIREPTVAFLPCGFNKIEPNPNMMVAKAIVDTGGCLLSIFPPNTQTSDKNFIMRDEFIAAASELTLAMQCGEKSGTMHTVNFAKNYGRKIATFLPDDKEGEDFSGNEFILNNKYRAFKVSGLDDFDGFIKFLNKEVKEKLVYKAKNEKEVVLKINPDGQCTFEFE